MTYQDTLFGAPVEHRTNRRPSIPERKDRRDRARAFTGMRSLSDVLTENQTMRAARQASLAEPEPEPKPEPQPEYLYGIRDGEVTEFRIIKRTPKFVKFYTGNPRPPGFRETFTDHLECYIEREPFERRGHIGVGWGPRYSHPTGVHVVYATREDAEKAAVR